MIAFPVLAGLLTCSGRFSLPSRRPCGPAVASCREWQTRWNSQQRDCSGFAPDSLLAPSSGDQNRVQKYELFPTWRKKSLPASRYFCALCMQNAGTDRIAFRKGCLRPVLLIDVKHAPRLTCINISLFSHLPESNHIPTIHLPDGLKC